MFVRNVYTPAEEKMLQEWNERSERLAGWLDETPSLDYPYPVWYRTASLDVIRHQAIATDYKNLLYRDEEYAKNSRWGGIIAPPFFLFSVVPCGGAFHFLAVPPEVGAIVAVPFGEGYEFFQPVRPGDSFKVWLDVATLEDITEDGEQPLRVFHGKESVRYFNQRDELVGIYHRNSFFTYAEPGYQFDGILRMGYELGIESGCGIAEAIGEVRPTPELHYTKEEIEAIDRIYENEIRQGRTIRWWEDVKVGDELPPVIMGPFTVWDSVTVLGTFGCAPLPMMEMRRQTPQRCIVDPVTNIPHKSIEIHLSPDVPRITHFPSPTLIENSIFGLFGRLLCNWAGDDGFIRGLSWWKFANTNFGDTVFARGKVLRKYIDETGDTVVDVDVWMENTRGFVGNIGPSVVSLQSKTKMMSGHLPEVPEQPKLNLNPAGLKVGDRFKIKARPDWEMPGEYPLTGKTGRIVELFHTDGYAFVLLDEDVTGLDPRLVLGFRLDALEKL